MRFLCGGMRSPRNGQDHSLQKQVRHLLPPTMERGRNFPTYTKTYFSGSFEGVWGNFFKSFPKNASPLPRVPLRFTDLFDLIAQEGGLLEFELLGSTLHFGGELGDELFFFGLCQLAIGLRAFFAAFG